jgi:hypothetical protein
VSRRKGLLIGLRRRAGFSAGGLVLFIVQFLVAPMVHLAHHEDDHTHGPDGHTHALTPRGPGASASLRARLLLWRTQHAADHARLHARGEAHDHATADLPPLAPRLASGHRLTDGDQRPPPDLQHGHGAAGHFGVSMLAARAVALAPPAAPISPLGVSPLASVWTPAWSPSAHRPRGPPPV